MPKTATGTPRKRAEPAGVRRRAAHRRADVAEALDVGRIVQDPVVHPRGSTTDAPRPSSANAVISLIAMRWILPCTCKRVRPMPHPFDVRLTDAYCSAVRRRRPADRCRRRARWARSGPGRSCRACSSRSSACRSTVRAGHRVRPVAAVQGGRRDAVAGGNASPRAAGSTPVI